MPYGGLPSAVHAEVAHIFRTNREMVCLRPELISAGVVGFGRRRGGGGGWHAALGLHFLSRSHVRSAESIGPIIKDDPS